MELKSNVSFENTEIAFSSRSNRAIKKARVLFASVGNPIISKLVTNTAKLALALGLPIKGIIKNTVFEVFCGGETIEESKQTIDTLSKYNVGTILDYSVEGKETEEAFDNTKVETIKTITNAKNNENIPFCVFKPTGVASLHLLEKIQLGTSLSDIEQAEFERTKSRIDDICKKAFENDVPLLIDAEDSWIQDPVDEIVYTMMAKYNKSKAIIFNTYQMYRVSSLQNLKNSFQRAVRDGYFLGVKLVRGAYMEKERERAKLMGYSDPIQPVKQATDEDYNQALKFCIDNKQRINVINCTHNEYSSYYLALLMEKHGMKNNDPRVWFAQLYGMSDNISFNLAKAGYNVAKYVPYGPVKSVMPYLFRRAEENTSVAGQSGRELTLIKTELKRRAIS
ncbi:MAG: proline dehydrogenase family protein [Cyclobacteriaceae bacterium]|nr:proline dehydrogenase family protein [Cyclobacteriaceae bacterium]